MKGPEGKERLEKRKGEHLEGELGGVTGATDYLTFSLIRNSPASKNLSDIVEGRGGRGRHAAEPGQKLSKRHLR